MKDPVLANATVIAVSVTPWPTQPETDLKLAAHTCRIHEGRFEETGGSIYVRVPSPRPDREIPRPGGGDAEQVVGLPAPAIALAYLNMHLTRPPYVLAVHHSKHLIDMLEQHRDQCPALAATDLVDTAQWAHHLHAIPPEAPLDACAHALDVHDGLEGCAVGTAARLTAAVFAHLALDESPDGPTSLNELIRVAGASASFQAVAA